MIKKYKELNESEKELVIEFLNRKNKKFKNIFEFEKSIDNSLYDFRSGILFYLENGKVIAKAFVILEPTKVLHAAYITGVDVLEGNIESLIKLLNACIDLSHKYTAKKIVLLSDNEDVWKLLKGVGIKKEYSAYKMELEKCEQVVEALETDELTLNNMQEYINVYNNAFKSMPHGCYTDEEDMKKRLNNLEDNEGYYLVKNKGVTVGFLNISIEGDRGFFDIGLHEKYRGQGLGKKLLETAIEILKRKCIKKISLIVIGKNKIAYNMYQKRGFKVYKKISDCVEINKI